MGYRFQNYEIPDRMMPGLTRYVEDRVAPGGFLMAVLENDLLRACGAADEENMANLPAYTAYLYNRVPSSCHGSPEKVKAWLAGG